MDAIRFLEVYKHMCGQDNGSCKECPLKTLMKKHSIDVCDDMFIATNPHEIVPIIEKWAEEHLK